MSMNELPLADVHHDDQQGRCPHPDCQEAHGWQCCECGHYYPASRIKRVGGEYQCRSGMGCQR